MPKTLPIIVDVEDVAVGRIMMLLNKTPGVIKFRVAMDEARNLGPNGSTKRAHNPDRKAPGRFAKPGEQAILELLYDDGPLLSSQLRDEFIKQGRSGASISSCLHKLKTDGDVNSGPEGYTLTKRSRDRLRSQMKGKKKR